MRTRVHRKPLYLLAIAAPILLLSVPSGGAAAPLGAQDGTATLTIHHRWCPAGFAGPDYYAACHDFPLTDWDLSMRGPEHRTGRTGADGNVSFTDLIPGTYQISGGGGPTDFVELDVFCAPAAAPGTKFPSTTEQLRGGPGTFLVELDLGAGDDVLCDFYVTPADLSPPNDGVGSPPATATDSRPATTEAPIGEAAPDATEPGGEGTDQSRAAAGCLATTEDDNEALARRWYEALDGGDLAALDALLAEDVVHHAGTFPDARGPHGVRRILAVLLAGFPDARFCVEQAITEGDLVVLRWTATGTHEGEFQGLEPTGEQATWTGINVFRVECGRMAEVWSDVDGLGRLRQLGALPDPTSRP